jgi:phosphate transport system substrate-binding protein
MPDGSIRIVGLDDMEGIVTGLNALYAKTHSGTRFTYVKSNSLAAIYSLIFDATAFAPAAIVYPSNLTYTDIVHGAPLSVRVAHGSLNPAAKVSGLAIIVNKSNPISRLTMAQVAPVGNNGADYAKREIHVYIPALRGLPVISTNRARVSNFAWTRRAEYLPMMEDVVNAVANDPFGIGITGWFPIDEGWDRQTELGSKVRLLPLSVTADSKASRGGPGDLYPLSGGLHLLINRAPGKPVDSWLREYVRFILSKEGQAILGSMTRTEGFIPLTDEEATIELQKIE